MHSSRKDFNLTALWNNSADDKSVLFAYFSQKIGFDICMQIVPLGDILHEMPVYFQGRIEMLKGFLSKIMHGKLIFFLFSPENRFWHFVQIVSKVYSQGGKLHEMSKSIFWEK